MLTPAQAAALRTQLLTEKLGQATSGDAKPGGVEGFLQGLTGHVGLGGLFGGTVDKAVGEIADSFIMSPVTATRLGYGIAQDIGDAVTFRTLWDKNYDPEKDVGRHAIWPLATGLAESAHRDVTHPLRNPGYTAMDAFAALSLGLGGAARAGAAGSAVRAAGGDAPIAPLVSRTQRIGAAMRPSMVDNAKALIEQRNLRAREKARSKINFEDRADIPAADKVAANESVYNSVPAAQKHFAEAATKPSFIGDAINQLHAADHADAIAQDYAINHAPSHAGHFDIVPVDKKSRTVSVVDKRTGKPTGVYATLTLKNAGKDWADVSGTVTHNEPIWAVYDVNNPATIAEPSAQARLYANLRKKIAEARRKGENYVPDQIEADLLSPTGKVNIKSGPSDAELAALESDAPIPTDSADAFLAGKAGGQDNLEILTRGPDPIANPHGVLAYAKQSEGGYVLRQIAADKLNFERKAVRPDIQAGAEFYDSMPEVPGAAEMLRQAQPAPIIQARNAVDEAKLAAYNQSNLAQAARGPTVGGGKGGGGSGGEVGGPLGEVIPTKLPEVATPQKPVKKKGAPKPRTPAQAKGLRTPEELKAAADQIKAARKEAMAQALADKAAGKAATPPKLTAKKAEAKPKPVKATEPPKPVGKVVAEAKKEEPKPEPTPVPEKAQEPKPEPKPHGKATPLQKLDNIPVGDALVDVKYKDGTVSHVQVSKAEMMDHEGDAVAALKAREDYSAKQVKEVSFHGYGKKKPEAAKPKPEGRKIKYYNEDGLPVYEDGTRAAPPKEEAPAPAEKPAAELKSNPKGKVVIRMTLKDGTVVEERLDKVPTNWKSRLMGQAKYGASKQGAIFERLDARAVDALKEEPVLKVAETKPVDQEAAFADTLSQTTKRPSAAQRASLPKGMTYVHVTEQGLGVAQSAKGRYHVYDREGHAIVGAPGTEKAKVAAAAMRQARAAGTAKEVDRLVVKAQTKGPESLTAPERKTLERHVDTNLHPALKALGLKIETPRGYGVSERQVGETFNLPKDQAKALSAVIFPKVRTLHHKYVTEGWSEATLRGQVTKMFKQVAKDEMGMDDAAAKELSGKAWGMIMRARGGSRGPLGPTESAKIFMREFSKARPRQSMTLTSERGLQGIDDPTALRLEKITAEYMLSNNAINRAVSRTVYGALQKLDVPEALGGKGNFANRQLRRKIMFENREIKRITDAMKTAGMTEEMQKAADLEKQLSKTLSPGNAAGRAMDTMNRAAIIGMLFLKPAYISANLLGQAMFMLADHSLNPASIYNSVHLQNEVLRGERNAFFRATPDAKADEFRSTYARQVRLGMGSEAGGLISSIKVKGSGGLLANAHTKMAKVFSSFLDTPWRDNAFFHEASRQGFNTADRIHELLNAGADTPLAAQRTDIFRRANRNLVDYSRMTETEINVVKRIVFFYPWMKGATIYGGRFAAEHPAQLLALSTQSEKTKEMTDKSLGMLPSFLQGVTKVGERNVPGLGLLPTVTNPQAISTLGTAGEALQMAKGLWTGRTKQSDLLANTLTPAASAILAATTHVDPFTGRKIKAENASALDIAANVLLKMPAPLRLLNQIQQADEIKKGNLDPSKFLEPMTKSEAFGRWLGPGFGAVAGHPLADFTLNTREARSRAASEARDLQSKADSKVALWKDYNQQVKLEAKRVGVPLSPLFTTSMALKAQREAAIAVWGSANGVSRPNSIQRLESDMSLLVRMKKIDEKQAKSILISMTRADQNTIDNFRRDLGEMYFGSTVLSAYRKALTDRGAKLPAF